jgi:hypothetical protein
MVYRISHPRRLTWAAFLTITLLHGACTVISGFDDLLSCRDGIG